MEQSLDKRIRQKSKELGFSHIRFARAEPLEKEGTFLDEWLNCNYHASMQWMKNNADKRKDPSKILPGVKSVLCVAMNYYTSAQHLQDESAAKISRYAWGKDYHDIMTGRLNELFAYIRSEVKNVAGKIYVDTGPVMDKAWAVRSGIGWMGKHTNIINRDFGSWMFLGEILLDIELEYDGPVPDYCGYCTACIDACPTKAIFQPYVIDSNKCISYLTIEHKGKLPTGLTGKFNNWIYGCDICQDVCPWNRFQKETKEPGFMPSQENIAPELNKLANITQNEFNGRFRKSPVKRLKLEGLVRNVRAILESGARSA